MRELAGRTRDGLPVIAYMNCNDPAFCNDAAVLEVALWGVPHRLTDGQRILLLQDEADAQGSRLLFLPSTPELYHTWGLGLAPGEQVGPYRLAQVEPGWASSLAGWTSTEPLTLANGAQLQGWRSEVRDGALRLWTLWRVASPPAQGQVQMFNHLYADGDKVAGEDFSVSIRAWQSGDWLVFWADLPVPEGGEALTFQVGMYDLATMERAAILERLEDPERAIMLE